MSLRLSQSTSMSVSRPKQWSPATLSGWKNYVGKVNWLVLAGIGSPTWRRASLVLVFALKNDCTHLIVLLYNNSELMCNNSEENTIDERRYGTPHHRSTSKLWRGPWWLQFGVWTLKNNQKWHVAFHTIKHLLTWIISITLVRFENISQDPHSFGDCVWNFYFLGA